LEPTISQSTAAKAGPEDAALQRHWTIQTDYGGLKSFLSGFSLNSRQALQYNFTANALLFNTIKSVKEKKKKKSFTCTRMQPRVINTLKTWTIQSKQVTTNYVPIFTSFSGL
jgi:hypothetical protein